MYETLVLGSNFTTISSIGMFFSLILVIFVSKTATTVHFSRFRRAASFRCAGVFVRACVCAYERLCVLVCVSVMYARVCVTLRESACACLHMCVFVCMRDCLCVREKDSQIVTNCLTYFVHCY